MTQFLEEEISFPSIFLIFSPAVSHTVVDVTHITKPLGLDIYFGQPPEIQVNKIINIFYIFTFLHFYIFTFLHFYIFTFLHFYIITLLHIITHYYTLLHIIAQYYTL
jgi:hypothetical protein